MSRRAVLALSAALTAFLLIVAGAAASLSLRSASTPAVRPAEGVAIDVVRAREAEYRRLIDEANARLREQQQVVVARAQPPEPTRVSARVVEDADEDDDEGESHERHGRRHAHHEDDDG